MLAAAALGIALRPAFAVTPPPIDGNAAAPAWRQGTLVPGSRTDVYVLEDARYLYVAFTARDGAPMRSGDVVGLEARDGSAAYTFEAEALGGRRARSNVVLRYDPAWGAAFRHAHGGYEATLRIPRAAVRGYAPAQWQIRFQRRIGATGRVLSSPFMHFTDARFAAVRRARAPMLQLAQNYRNAWRGPLVPNIPNAQRGVELSGGLDDLAFEAVDVPQTGGRDDAAQGITYSLAGGRLFASLARVQTTQPGSVDTTQNVSIGYAGSRVSLNAGFADDVGVRQQSRAQLSSYDAKFDLPRGWLEATWSCAGPDFVDDDGPPIAAGSRGYALAAQRDFAGFSLDGELDRYRNADGALAQADRRLSASVKLPRAWGTFSLGRVLTQTPAGTSSGTTAAYERTVAHVGTIGVGYGRTTAGPSYDLNYAPPP